MARILLLFTREPRLTTAREAADRPRSTRSGMR